MTKSTIQVTPINYDDKKKSNTYYYYTDIHAKQDNVLNFITNKTDYVYQSYSGFVPERYGKDKPPVEERQRNHINVFYNPKYNDIEKERSYFDKLGNMINKDSGAIFGKYESAYKDNFESPVVDSKESMEGVSEEDIDRANYKFLPSIDYRLQTSFRNKYNGEYLSQENNSIIFKNIQQGKKDNKEANTLVHTLKINDETVEVPHTDIERAMNINTVVLYRRQKRDIPYDQIPVPSECTDEQLEEYYEALPNPAFEDNKYRVDVKSPADFDKYLKRGPHWIRVWYKVDRVWAKRQKKNKEGHRDYGIDLTALTIEIISHPRELKPFVMSNNRKEYEKASFKDLPVSNLFDDEDDEDEPVVQTKTVTKSKPVEVEDDDEDDEPVVKTKGSPNKKHQSDDEDEEEPVVKTKGKPTKRQPTEDDEDEEDDEPMVKTRGKPVKKPQSEEDEDEDEPAVKSKAKPKPKARK